jgi:ELWxxDGT repeat protein
MSKSYCLICLFAILYFSSNGQTFSLVKDINPGTASSSPAGLTNADDRLFFKASDAAHGDELWKSDGTAAGTFLVKDIKPGPNGSSPSGLLNVNGVIYFKANDGVHGDELWITDGSEAGTVMLKDIFPGVSGSSPSSLITINGIVFFTANDGVNGNELWKTNGTEAGTMLVKDIRPGSGSSSPASFTILNNKLYFSATDATDKGALWKSDGTAAGTALVKNVVISQMKNIKNTLVFSESGAAPSLWKSDGTAAGTIFLKNTGAINSLTDVNGTIFFYTIGAGANITIWKSDGTTNGTVQVKQINGTSNYSIDNFTSINGRLFFAAPHPASGTELWVSDGTGAGTGLVNDIFPGGGSSDPSNFSNINGELYFCATNGTNGKEIWKSDGTATGTIMVKDIANPGDGMPSEFTLSGSKLFVSVTHNSYGRELWVADISDFIYGGLPLTMIEFKGKLTDGNALLNWKTIAEHNTSRFEIERSIDGSSFTKCGTVAAAGNSTVVIQYEYTDRSVVLIGASQVYYRLKMMDIDNKFTYSRIVAINMRSSEAVIMLYYNPVRESGTLMVSVAKKENITCRIIDANGRIVQRRELEVNEGSNTVSFQTNSLAAGAYSIILTGTNTNRQLRFIKL